MGSDEQIADADFRCELSRWIRQEGLKRLNRTEIVNVNISVVYELDYLLNFKRVGILLLLDVYQHRLLDNIQMKGLRSLLEVPASIRKQEETVGVLHEAMLPLTKATARGSCEVKVRRSECHIGVGSSEVVGEKS